MQERSGLRAAGAALLVFAALLFGASAPSAASAYTMAFTGTVTSIGPSVFNGGDGLFQALGIVAGDPVSGSLTFDPLNENPPFSQSSAAFSFHVSHPGAGALTVPDSGTGAVYSSALLGLFVSGANSHLDLSFATSTTGPLSSLAGLPDSPGALLAWLGGTPYLASGNFDFRGFGAVDFDIALTATPIPPALPLFVSALGGLGFMAWRRRTSRHGRRHGVAG
jgi:hypothetical protein